MAFAIMPNKFCDYYFVDADHPFLLLKTDLLKQSLYNIRSYVCIHVRTYVVTYTTYVQLGKLLQKCNTLHITSYFSVK